jgi:hypothetical protein
MHVLPIRDLSGDARTRRASPRLLLIQPDLGLQSPELDVPDFDFSASSTFFPSFGDRLIHRQSVDFFLERRNDLGLPGSRLAKHFQPSTCTDPGNPSIILSEKKGTIIIENR